MLREDSPVVFVHGLIGTLQLPQLGAALAPRAASAPDLLGYGQLRDVDPSAVTLAGQVARLPAQLVAGARSRDGWDVPAWALAGAATMTVVAGRGHLMPLEDPGEFGQLVRRLLAA